MRSTGLFLMRSMRILLTACVLAGCARSSEHELGQLHDAAAKGDLDTVQRLIEAGADVNAQDGKGRTALHHAANSNNADMIQLLAQQGADPTILDHTNSTPLDQADKNGMWNAYKALKVLGAH